MALPPRQVYGGSPYSDAYQPKKTDIIELWQATLAKLGGANAGALIQTSKAGLDALAPAANTMAWVIGDADPDLDGVYQYSGGAWTKRGPLPYGVIHLNNAGAGTGDAIEVTTAFGVPDAAYGVVYSLNITEANTGPVTISINGAAPIPVVSNTGAPLDAGALQPEMGLLALDDGTNLRLFVYANSEAILAGAEAARDEAQAAAASVSARIFTDLATAAAATIPAGTKRLRTQFYAPVYAEPATLVGGAHYKRVAVEPAHALKFRSTDRFLPDGTADATNGGWWEIDEVEVLPTMAGTVPDGATDCQPALDAWLTYLCDIGGFGRVDGGDYSMANGVVVALNASCRIIVSPNARFVAAPSFPAGPRMFLFNTGVGTGHQFDWEGGDFDGINMPNAGAGSDNNVFSFNAENCDRLKIILDKVTTGDNWLDTGADASHLFIGGALNIHAEIRNSLGATDAGMYISSSANGSRGRHLIARGNYEKCSVGIIVKREFETYDIDAQVTDCLNGVACGTANAASGALLAPGDGFRARVNALRTERPMSLMGGRYGTVEVNAKDIGVAIPGYTSATAKGLYLLGSSRVSGVVNVHGVNPACVKNANFRAVDAARQVIEGVNYDATDNMLQVNASDVGRSVAEDANAIRNFYVIRENNVTQTIAAAGGVRTGSFALIASPDSGILEIITGGRLSLGGYSGTEALRILENRDPLADYLQVRAVATAPAIEALGPSANIDIRILPKGAGLLRLGATPVAAANPAAFSAERYVEVRMRDGTIWYWPLMSAPW